MHLAAQTSVRPAGTVAAIRCSTSLRDPAKRELVDSRGSGSLAIARRIARHPMQRARRLLRQAPPLPPRRFRHHRCRHRPRPHGARSWRGRFPAVQGSTASIRSSRSRATASIAPTGRGSAGRARHHAKLNAPDGPICSDLREAGALLAASADYKHSYPHSWRSKAKVIFRATPQWFIPMDAPVGDGLAFRCAEEEAILTRQSNDADPARNRARCDRRARAGCPRRRRTASTRWSPAGPTG